MATPVDMSGDTVSQFNSIYSVSDNITAHAGGGQGSATALPSAINRVTTVATAADSVVLPAATAAIAGMTVTVINSAASNSLTAYPASGDAINILSANTGLAIAAGKTAEFICTGAGHWHAILSA